MKPTTVSEQNAALLRENELLKKMLLSQTAVVTPDLIDKTSKEVIEQLSRKVDEQASLIEKLKRMIFGQKRERFIAPSDIQLSIFPEQNIEIPAEVQEEIVEQIQEIKENAEKEKSNHKGRLPLPSHLDVVEEIIEPEGDLSEMVCVGEEITEILEYQPAKLFIRRIIRKKYAPKSKEGSFKIAPLPDRFLNKGIAGTSLIAQILVDKYIDHLPLYRIKNRFARDKIVIKDSTIDGWVRHSIDQLAILYRCLAANVTTKKYLQVDETTLRVLDHDLKGKTHLGYYWAYHSPMDDSLFFEYNPSRKAEVVNTTLENFNGYLQTDGYKGYDKPAKKEGVIHLACWAHVRRGFHEALTNDKKSASEALKSIQELYNIEAKAKHQGLNPDEIKELRLKESLPLYNKFGIWLAAEEKKTTPSSAIGAAIAYTIKRWDALCNYMHDGNLLIDNNLIENAIRPIALGRKNYLFAGSHEGAKRAAIIYTLFANCKKHDVNPTEWLKYTLDNIMTTKVTEIHNLLPQNYKKSVNQEG